MAASGEKEPLRSQMPLFREIKPVPVRVEFERRAKAPQQRGVMLHGSRRDLQILRERGLVGEVARADSVHDREKSPHMANRGGVRAFLLYLLLHGRVW